MRHLFAVLRFLAFVALFPLLSYHAYKTPTVYVGWYDAPWGKAVAFRHRTGLQFKW